MRILGISAFYHDAAAALLVDGCIVAAAQEERFTRKRHDAAFPAHAVRYCLKEAKIELKDLDHIVFYDKPFLKFERLLETFLAFAPRGFRSFHRSMPSWLKEKLFQKNLLERCLGELAPGVETADKLLFTEHHQAHAASAFFPSPFEKAAVLTLDGVGEWTTTSVAIGDRNRLEVIKEIHFPHSLGLLYSAFTYHAGFKVNSGEYKLMGLAPYGRPRFRDLILDHLIDLKDDGSYRLDLSYFDYCTGDTMTGSRFSDLFGSPPRKPGEPITEHQMDLAASIQAVTEEAILRLTRRLRRDTGLPNLCLAGGVALNCVANGKVLRDGAFKNIWIQPAAGDAGGALGAALAAHYLFKNGPRSTPQALDAMAGSYLGPSFTQTEIENSLRAAGARFKVLSDGALLEATAGALAGGKAVGWFQGRMEFGPRALGSRSILGDPRSPTLQKTLNLKIKYRESFRPFAPSVLREDAHEWFDLDTDSPYMLLVAPLREKHRHPSALPAVTHVDHSARVQTVHAETHPRYHALLTAFKNRTGCPVLVNTSFNIRGEPIVCTPEDAFRCFMGTEIDALAIGNCFLEKESQDSSLRAGYASYKDGFDLD